MAKLGKTLLVVIVGIVLNAELVNAQLRCPLDNRNDNLATQFVIRGTSIQMPVGAFLLVRKNGEVGAIRLTNIDPAVTEDYGEFTYESYFPSDAAGLFRSGKLGRHAGELDVRPSKGTRGIYYQPGLHKASIGKWTFAFDVPSRMHMSGISFWKEDRQPLRAISRRSMPMTSGYTGSDTTQMQVSSCRCPTYPNRLRSAGYAYDELRLKCNSAASRNRSGFTGKERDAENPHSHFGRQPKNNCLPISSK